MRKARLKNDGEGFYHVTSRCVDRTFRFDDEDKTHIVEQIKRMGRFCGVEIGTSAVMSNHFHILLHVLPPQELADEELLGRVAALYGSERAEKLRVEWASYRRVGDEAAMRRLEEERAALLRRMGDLSQYMKELKQWISRDYNKKVGRKGPPWPPTSTATPSAPASWSAPRTTAGAATPRPMRAMPRPNGPSPRSSARRGR